MPTDEPVAQPAPPDDARLTRRTVLGKARYLPPAIAALSVLQPEVALGRSGPTKKDKGKGKGKGQSKRK